MNKIERLIFHLESEIEEYRKVIKQDSDFDKFEQYVQLTKLQYKKFKINSGILGVWKGGK